MQKPQSLISIEHHASRTLLVTRKGQVTIPAAIRRALGIIEGDRISVEQQDSTVLLRRATRVEAQTRGALAVYRLPRSLSAQEEREAFAQHLAHEVHGMRHSL